MERLIHRPAVATAAGQGCHRTHVLHHLRGSLSGRLLPLSCRSLHRVRRLSCLAQDTRAGRPSLAAHFLRWTDSLVQATTAINGFSDLILDLFGPEGGQHARIAVGMATLPQNFVVTIAAEVECAA